MTQAITNLYGKVIMVQGQYAAVQTYALPVSTVIVPISTVTVSLRYWQSVLLISKGPLQ